MWFNSLFFYDEIMKDFLFAISMDPDLGLHVHLSIITLNVS